MGVFLTTSPVCVCVVITGVLCLATSPAWVRVAIVGALFFGASSTQVRVGEPVVPCFFLLLRASAYDFIALAMSASLFVMGIELCIKLGKEVFKVGGCGFTSSQFREKSCCVMHVGKVED